jgi:hypothetical protein
MIEEWLEPWYLIEDEHIRKVFGEELQKELGRRHPLYRLPAKVIARREDQDDVLVTLGDGRVAEVHLTWSRKREVHPECPETTIFSSIEEWREREMKPAHEDWVESGS